MTYLCVPILVESVAQAKQQMALAAEAGADMVELRLDEFTEPGPVEALLRSAPVPTIATCRPQWEGGESSLDDVERFRLLDECIDDTASYIDLELKAYQNSGSWLPRDKCPGLIVSSHDFTGRPARLYKIVGDLNASSSDVNKIAWMARSIRDNLEAFELLQSRQKPTIALCMGEAGLMSRVLAKKFGAFLTFASLRPTEATAPGQPTIEEMKRLYRWDAINEKTKVFGVVGSPIAHSMSPAIHNAAFDHTGFDGVYLPMLVEPSYESFKAFMESFLAFPSLDLTGLSITIPHKENALKYLQSKGATIDELAQKIGAVNTISIDPTVSGGAQLRGFNTDHDAILDSITEKLQITREQLSDYRIAIIGAGGTARTAVAALASHGATVVIYNRTREKADALAAEFNNHSSRVVAARMEKLCDSCCHIFINATPVGMYPNIDASPLDGQSVHFTPETLVFDTIYNPARTKLIRLAQEQGAKTIAGEEMFIRQAVAQFRIFTGGEGAPQVMRQALQSRLAQLESPTSE
ncbi:shikimate dehydrogenase [soil metagenome]